jgi:exopolysaccharide/PEP-CTERM locus tyrosine autokinase
VSRVEDALKKLRESGAAPPPVARSNPPPAPPKRSAVPVAQKKKVTVEGEKHAVSQEELIAGGLLAPFEQAGAVADEFRRIKRPLILNAIGETAGSTSVPNRNVIMIASAMPGAGKTFCAVNLAVSISLERELNVVLVDADVAKPHVSRAFGLVDRQGLIDLLLDETLDMADLLVRTDLNDIQVLPAGQPHPQATELLASDRMSRVVTELSTRYSDRVIILDSPPLLLTSEAQALASQVGQIALVVEAGRTTQQALNHTLDSLDSEKAINVILNKTRSWNRGGYYGGYGYYGNEYYGSGNGGRNGEDA